MRGGVKTHMANFLLVYHAGPNQGDAGHEAQLSNMQAWLDWMGGLGSALVDAGNPIARAWTLSKDGTTEGAGPNPASGYTVIKADSMQAASEMVIGCPHLATGGTIELCEMLTAGHAAAR